MTSAMRNHVKSFNVRLGPFAATGRLVGVRKSKSKESKTNFVTPDGLTVQQRYVDSKGDLWQVGDLTKGTVDEDGKVKIIDAEALKEASTSKLPSGVLDLTVHPPEAADQVYIDEQNGYVWYPDQEEQKNVDLYDMILTVIRHSKNTLIGMCNLKGHEGLYTLVEWRGYIVLQKVLYPASLNPHETRKSEVPVAARKSILKIVDSLVAPFDPELYDDQHAAAKRVVIDAATAPGEKPKKVAKKKEAPVVHDMMATLRQMEALVGAEGGK